MNLAVIPARGGSKRIRRKNIRLFAGIPMVAHAITAARKSSLFEHVIVSTDDAEIAETAAEWGAETPFIRPSELADDYTPTVPVVVHAINACEALGWRFDHVCCIYPCVPFIQIGDLKAAMQLLKTSKSDYCFPVTTFPSAIQRALKKNENGLLSPFYPDYELTRSQDLELAYHDAGQFYWASTQAWLRNPRIHSSAVGFDISNWRVIDIDTTDDWKRAERMFEALEKTKSI